MAAILTLLTASLQPLRLPRGASWKLPPIVVEGSDLDGASVVASIRAMTGAAASRVWTGSSETGGSGVVLDGQSLTVDVPPTALSGGALAYTLASIVAPRMVYGLDFLGDEGQFLFRLQGNLEWIGEQGGFAGGAIEGETLTVSLVPDEESITVQVLGASDGGAMTGAEILAVLLPVDGTGSGLDADLLAGNQASAFATAAQGTDARTPTAHAASHVTGGADKLRDATASQDGLMTAAFATKLNGIAASANNYTLPAPGPTTLGGVKRNAGSAGEFVTGISDTGDLLRGTPAGGGSAISNPGVAYVRSGGNDTTAVVGNPALPFATMQAAYNHASAPRTFYVGQGIHAGITTTGNIDISILGLGRGVTTITLIKSTTAGNTTKVRDLGVHSVLVDTIGAAPDTAPDDTAGYTGNSITVENLLANTVFCGGGTGGSASANPNSGGAGGAAGSFTSLGRCTIGSVYAAGGDGGAGDGDPDGTGGNGGVCTLSNGTKISTLITANGGESGSGTGGNGGTIVGKFFEINGTATLSGGLGGSGNGTAGTVDITSAFIWVLDGDGGSGDLVINALLSRINTTGGVPDVTAVEISKVNGVIY